ncbi:MAG TPA: hypothetical protein H9867_03040 [Candidatus Corynebacterium gallistercoris]|uniref:Uncharacterized protein n=1 Tax=Candidatus Corynebacterium gallistercoris TaxID=2838530 RepID=A0A9D1RY62_9CORY|nr:hypothetical protein [Candidatus Corynebacterium gallistercoris]
MLDPTRIPGVMAALQHVWEAQPGVPFAQLWAQLEGLGVGFNSTDEELQRGCEQVLAVHPASVGDAPGGHTVVIECFSPTRRLTLSLPPDASSDSSGSTASHTGGTIAVHGQGLQPVVWNYARIVRCQVGFPVVIEDTSGARHRLGVATRLTVADFAMTGDQSLSGLDRAELAGAVYLVALEDGTMAQLDHRLSLFAPSRRDLQVSRLKWVSVERCEVGQPLVVATAGGSAEQLGVVRAITRAQ